MDNATFSNNISRAVTNDVAKYLPIRVSEEFSGPLAQIFQNVSSVFAPGISEKRLLEALSSKSPSAPLVKQIPKLVSKGLSLYLANIFQKIYSQPVNAESRQKLLDILANPPATNSLQDDLPRLVSDELSIYLARLFQKLFCGQVDDTFEKSMRDEFKMELLKTYKDFFVLDKVNQENYQTAIFALSGVLKKIILKNYYISPAERGAATKAHDISVLTASLIMQKFSSILFPSRNLEFGWKYDLSVELLGKYFPERAAQHANEFLHIEHSFQRIILRLADIESANKLRVKFNEQLSRENEHFFVMGYANPENFNDIADALKKIINAIVSQHFSINPEDTALNDMSVILALMIRHRFVNTFPSSFAPRLGFDEAYLAEVFQKRFSPEIARAYARDFFRVESIFQKIFSKLAAQESEKNLREIFRARLLEGFTQFLADGKMSSETFKDIKNPLRMILREAVATHFGISPANEKLSKIAHPVASIIANEFSSAFSSSFIQFLARNRAELRTVFEKSFEPTVAEQYTKEFFQQVMRARSEVQPFLPINYIEPCDCNQEKKVHAALSSPIYYFVNVLITSLPQELMKYNGFISPRTYFLWNNAAFLVMFVIYGQSLNEYKIAREKPCTKHRYLTFMRNKAHSFGIGEAYYFLRYAIVSVLGVGANLDNLLTGGNDYALERDTFAAWFRLYLLNDAVANMIMQFGSASMLAFNEPLPGKKTKNKPRDLFLLPRLLTRRLRTGVEWLVQRTDDPLNKFKRILNSPMIDWTVDLLLSDSNFFPRLELISPWSQKENKFVFPWDKKDVIRKPEFVLSKIPSVKLALELYQEDIQAGMKEINKYRIRSNSWFFSYALPWLELPLMALPIPALRLALSFVVRPLIIMKDEEITALVERFFSAINGYYSESLDVVLYEQPNIIRAYKVPQNTGGLTIEAEPRLTTQVNADVQPLDPGLPRLPSVPIGPTPVPAAESGEKPLAVSEQVNKSRRAKPSSLGLLSAVSDNYYSVASASGPGMFASRVDESKSPFKAEQHSPIDFKQEYQPHTTITGSHRTKSATSVNKAATRVSGIFKKGLSRAATQLEKLQKEVGDTVGYKKK